MSTARKIALFLIATPIAVFLVFYSIGHLPSPPIRDYDVENARRDLAECKTDQIQMVWFDRDGFKAHLQIDLTSKILRCEGMVGNPEAMSTPTWGAIFKGYYPPHLTAAQLQQVDDLLVTLPPGAAEAPFWDNSAYRKLYQLAFYKSGALQIRCYPKNDRPKEFVDLLKFLCVDDYYR